MRFSEIFAASLVAPLVAAHGGIPGLPKIVGLGGRPIAISQLKSRNAFEGHVERAAHAKPKPVHKLDARQGGLNGRCGPSFGNACCAAGYCCSSEGWCGQGEDYCMAPDCQFNYGPACDANTVPSGGSTKNTPRPKLGSVPYGGEGVYPCTVPGDVAITYDDGPYEYTAGLLDLFKSYNMKATFFVTGININKGSIDDASTPWPAVIKRMIAEGHQVASHTWSHQDLSTITKTQRYDQLVRNEMALSNIIGKFPTYMRPPYSSCTAASGCAQDMADLGYVISYFDLDSDDYNNVTPQLIQNAKDRVFNAINPSNPASDSFLGIAHDIHQQTATNLTTFWLDLLVQKGYRGVTMGECLGDPQANWYRTPSARTASSSAFTCPGTSATLSSTRTGTATSSAATTTATNTSPDSSCGGTTGYTCLGFAQGECCSQYGYCGNTEGHCGTGCQALFGKCGSGSSSSSASTTVRSTGSASGTSSAPSSTASAKVSTDGSCGGTNGYTCVGSTFGNCCSQYGWCGSTVDHCTNCNAAFGTCTSSSVSSLSSVASVSSRTASSSRSSSVAASSVSSSSPARSSSTSIRSVSSTISSTRTASSTGRSSSTQISSTPPPSSSSSSTTRSSSSTAVRSSSSSTVRSTSSLVTSTRTSSSATPSSTLKVSTNGRCGSGAFGGNQTCKNSQYGSCCRFDGKCGSSLSYCGVGCQKSWGTCM